ncbi:hypothetical protein [Paenibacillus nasutitermitis]|uniref:Uncharacterized protein n=1 Tax=Paenibacillus nasutitermitis TaxID=1652958 RepID=A0A917DUA8_9BACL|nr:hypothetical protein [Paenibacillus nasutitermitis]GGD71095.1 hypothetical protein GCM10010911_31210 [Paenibacillus nasutitermitis]
MINNVHYKIELLRPVELLCYQVAHYVLGNDYDAAEASKEALIELYQMPQFVICSEDERQSLAKAAAVRNALRHAGQRSTVQ